MCPLDATDEVAPVSLASSLKRFDAKLQSETTVLLCYRLSRPVRCICRAMDERGRSTRPRGNHEVLLLAGLDSNPDDGPVVRRHFALLYIVDGNLLRML